MILGWHQYKPHLLHHTPNSQVFCIFWVDITLRAESEEELKSLLMRVIEESEKVVFIQDMRRGLTPQGQDQVQRRVLSRAAWTSLFRRQ